MGGLGKACGMGRSLAKGCGVILGLVEGLTELTAIGSEDSASGELLAGEIAPSRELPSLEP